MINGYVDVAKDPWIFKIQGNKQNTPQLLFMVMSGMSVKDIVYLTSMPMVVEYNKIKAEMTGVFSDLSTEIGKDPIASSSKVATRARQEMFRRYNESGLFKEMKQSYKASQYKEIANTITDDYTWEKLKELGSKTTRSFEEFKILTHYFEIEDMGNDMTEFQTVTKFDTQKISSISEAQERIDNTKKMKARKNAVPNKWFSDIEPTAVGIFNNDEFVISMFSKYFALRNNPVVVKASINVKVPKGSVKTVVQSSFKNDFLAFLYQNSLFTPEVYSGYKLQELTGEPNSILDIDEETKTITYGSYHLRKRKEEVVRVIAGPTGFIDEMNNMFPTDDHFLRFEIEFQKIEKEVEGMTDDQVLEYLDYANSYSTSTGTPIGVKYKAALYRSDNNIAMFDFRMGMGSILKKIVQRNPELRSQFRLINDMRYDSNMQHRKTNMWLSEVKDSDIARIYIENLRVLKNHSIPDVATFFKKFENMILMQTGMNRSSKYDMGKIINQSMFNDVIENGLGVDRILRDLKNVEMMEAKGEVAESKYLSSFTKIYDFLTADANRYRLRVRGVNYIVDDFDSDIETAVLSTLTYNNVSIVNNFNDVPQGVTILEVEDLYHYENGGLNSEYISELKDTPVYIMDQKMLAPEGESQTELDAVLKDVLGILNTGRNPSLIAMSFGQSKNNISIATAEGLKMQHAHKDETMANESQVAIGKPTLGNPLYKSSSQIYVDEIERLYPERLADSKTSFKKSQNVWVFGSGVFPNAYKGVDGGQSSYEQMIKETFDKYHAPLIGKAIKAGVTTFFVGNSSGIDALAGELLIEKGFTAVTRYSSIGKYYEYVKDVSNVYNPLYQIAKPSSSIYDLGLGFVFNKDLAKDINNMKEEESITSSPYEIVKADIVAKATARFPENKSREYNFFKVLSDNPGAIVAGSSNYSSLVEKVLMEFRSTYDSAQERKAIKEDILITQKINISDTFTQEDINNLPKDCE